MKGRIQELAKKAGGSPNYSSFREHFFSPSPDYIDRATLDLEKFAELIIGECYAWAKENGGLSDSLDYVELNKHFGIQQ